MDKLKLVDIKMDKLKLVEGLSVADDILQAIEQASEVERLNFDQLRQYAIMFSFVTLAASELADIDVKDAIMEMVRGELED